MATQRTRHLINQTIFHIVVIALGYVMLYPILWMVFNSFKTNAEIFNSGVLLPSSWKLDNFVRGWQFNRSVSFSVFFKNSFYYTIISTIGAVIASSLVGYGFARIPFRGRSFWYACMFLTIMLPYQVVMVPQFIIFHKLGWVNTFKPLIIPQFAGVPFFIFLMVQFIRQIPTGSMTRRRSMDATASASTPGSSSPSSGRQSSPARSSASTGGGTTSSDRCSVEQDPPLHRLAGLADVQRPMTSTDWGAIFAMGTLSLLPVLIIFLIFRSTSSKAW